MKKRVVILILTLVFLAGAMAAAGLPLVLIWAAAIAVGWRWGERLRALEETADDAQRGSFAAARGAEQCEEFTVVEVDVDRIEDGLAVKIHPAIYQPYELFRHYPPPLCLESPLSDGTDDYGS